LINDCLTLRVRQEYKWWQKSRELRLATSDSSPGVET